MTHEQAVYAAATEALKFGAPMTVYRFSAWPPEVYGVRASDKLPREALTFEQFDPPASAAAVVEASAPAAGQGSLF